MPLNGDVDRIPANCIRKSNCVNLKIKPGYKL